MLLRTYAILDCSRRVLIGLGSSWIVGVLLLYSHLARLSNTVYTQVSFILSMGFIGASVKAPSGSSSFVWALVITTAIIDFFEWSWYWDPFLRLQQRDEGYGDSGWSLCKFALHGDSYVSFVVSRFPSEHYCIFCYSHRDSHCQKSFPAKELLLSFLPSRVCIRWCIRRV